MKKVSLPIQIVVAVLIGSLLGTFSPANALEPLSEVGKIFIHLIKIVAGPFLFFTIFMSVLEVQISWRHGIKLLGIAVLNTSIALSIGIVLSLLFFKGQSSLPISSELAQFKAPEVQYGFSAFVKTFMPQSMLGPFVHNEILLIAIFALVLGIATRKAQEVTSSDRQIAFMISSKIKSVIEVLLNWLIRAIPLAVLFIIASTVNKYGFNIFAGLARFISVILLSFTLQIIIAYGFWIKLVARYSIKEFIRITKVPFFYSLGVNSSLATLPMTLAALKELKVSDTSASLGAGVATNLNNDGIVLYEAMALYFIAFSFGIPLDPLTMISIALTCMVASMGITGIPEAGFISLSVVVGILGFPTEALPILLAVDWFIARFRSAVNVMSDITLAVALDATETNNRKG